MASILIVDDLSSIHEMLGAVIEPTGHKCVFAHDGEKALSLYKSASFDVVLADISMQPMDGITLLKQLKSYDPRCVVTLMTGYASTDTAIKALKFGAFDYIKKPFKVDELLDTLERAVEFRGSKGNNPEPSDRVEPSPQEHKEMEEVLPGNSDKIIRLRQQVAKLVGYQTPALLQGESGTGKKAIADILHRKRNGNDAPLVFVDCTLCEEENFRESLFGADNQGGIWITAAAGGTLFLGQIECLADELQEILVSVLRNNINRFRLICSANVDLEDRIDEGGFSDELFYRIATLPVNIPPLREHPTDIPEIVKSRVARVAISNFDARQIEFTDEAMNALAHYGWPGNMTELVQVISSVVATTESRVIGIDRLPLRIRPFQDWPTLDEYLAPRERHYIKAVLAACDNDEEKAAAILGCDPSRISSLVNS